MENRHGLLMGVDVRHVAGSGERDDLRKLPQIGLAKVNAWVHWNFVTYNLIRLGGIGGWWNFSPT